MMKPNVIRIMCPNLSCQRILAVPSHARGRLVRCKSCGTTIRIPVAKEKKAVPEIPPEGAAPAA
jgi:ribosomal protein S27E